MLIRGPIGRCVWTHAAGQSPGGEAWVDVDSLGAGNLEWIGKCRRRHNAGGAVPGKPHVYTVPARLGLNQWALSGNWTMEEEATTPESGAQACSFTFG